MGFRFRKSFKIAPGVKLNLGKKSAGISIGGKGGGLSFNTKNGVRARASVPGTGISYSTKVGGGTKSSKKKRVGSSGSTSTHPSDPVMSKRPIPRRTWFLVVSILFIIGGLSCFATDVATAVTGLAIGGVMLFFRFRTPDEKPYDISSFQRQLQIFDESVGLFMSTDNPETFFGRYQDAINAAEAMAEMTDQPVCHGEPPQEAIAMMESDQVAATNAFLDRYAKKVRMAAYDLTRGREKKMESFKLVTSEYEDRMTEESITYRDTLYEEMLSIIRDSKNDNVE